MNSFNWEQYLLNYSDLKCIKTKNDAIYHYNHFGENEYRTDNIDKKKIKITIITPCIRPDNLQIIKDSINFEHVCEWIIVYDLSKIKPQKNFENDKISEYNFTSEGVSGNPQRNFALTKVKNEESYIYYLDDDNIVHPELYNLNLLPNKFYTFNQITSVHGTGIICKDKLRLKGNFISIGRIDSAMFLIYYPLVKGILWKIDKYEADGHYIHECYLKNKNCWIYKNKELCYYNYIKL